MSEFNLATADKAALKTFAINELNLNLPLTMNEDTMKQKIVDRCGELNMDPPKARIELPKHAGKHKYVTVNVSKQPVKGDGGFGSSPVFVGFQAKGYMIPRGINIDIPEPLVEVLQNAIQDIVTQDDETGEILHDDLMTHPFQIIGPAKAA